MWNKFLNRNQTVTTVAAGTIDGGTTLAEYKAQLDPHGIQDQHLGKIMGNNTTTEAIRGGRLSTMIGSLKRESTIPHDKWYTILANRHCSMVLLDDTFKDMISDLRQAGIPPQYYQKILRDSTASKMIRTDRPAFQRVIGALRVSGLYVDTWHTMLTSSPVINAIANGTLPKITRNLNLDGRRQHE